MSKETSRWLNTQTLIGYTDARGKAWHYRAEDQGDESNHYPGPVPVGDVERRLFNWQADERPILIAASAEDSLTSPDTPVGTVAIPDRKAIVRSDTNAVLGIFKDGYEPHQYPEWLLKNVATILDDQLGIGSAGLLKGGAVAWVQVEVPDSITTPEGVEYRPHLLACTSFDGSLATTFKRCVTNVVCDNTMSAGLRENGHTFKVKHSKYSTLKISDARDALQIIYDAADDFAAEVKALCETTVSNHQFQQFLGVHTPLVDDKGKDKQGRSLTMATNERKTLANLYTYDPRVAPWTGTAWGVMQAVNTYAHHEGIVRGASRPERNMLRAVTGGVDDLDLSTAEQLSKVLASV